ncbi:hypothetical protein B0H14DRAFT_3171846 [Mycena olivaceomarginata]|nr:hypothetical protein B0H14DRAFT_3171846 [Mycena olivaceomarginata]
MAGWSVGVAGGDVRRTGTNTRERWREGRGVWGERREIQRGVEHTGKEERRPRARGGGVQRRLHIALVCSEAKFRKTMPDREHAASARAWVNISAAGRAGPIAARTRSYGGASIVQRACRVEDRAWRAWESMNRQGGRMCRAVAPCIEVRMAAGLRSQRASGSTFRSHREFSAETQQRGKSEWEVSGEDEAACSWAGDLAARIKTPGHTVTTKVTQSPTLPDFFRRPPPFLLDSSVISSCGVRPYFLVQY